jgi:hypothetical protein
MADEKEKRQRKLFTPGEFRARCIEGVMGETKAGDPQLVAVFELLSGPDNGQQIPWWAGFKTVRQQDFTKKAMQACGWDESGLDEEALRTLTRNEVLVTIETQTLDDGTKSSRIAFVNEAGSGRFVKKKLSPSGVKTLEGLLGVKSNAKPRDEAPAKSNGGFSDADYGSTDDSDIPF